MYNVAPGVLITHCFLLSTDPSLGPLAAAYGPTDTQTHIKPIRIYISLCNAKAILHNPWLSLSPYPTLERSGGLEATKKLNL